MAPLAIVGLDLLTVSHAAMAARKARVAAVISPRSTATRSIRARGRRRRSRARDPATPASAHLPTCQHPPVPPTQLPSVGPSRDPRPTAPSSPRPDPAPATLVLSVPSSCVRRSAIRGSGGHRKRDRASGAGQEPGSRTDGGHGDPIAAPRPRAAKSVKGASGRMHGRRGQREPGLAHPRRMRRDVHPRSPQASFAGAGPGAIPGLRLGRRLERWHGYL